MVLIFLGLSGSGKGTQAELLVNKFGFEYIVMSDLLRNEIKKETALGRKINELMNIKGELVPDDITTEIFKKGIYDKLQSRQIIIDGYPRTLLQAENLKQIFDEFKINNFIALYIKISEQEALKRLLGRLVCLKCKTIHFPGDLKCRKCGAKLAKREDDEPEKIKKRISWGKKEVEKVVDYYRNLGKFIEISGEGGVDEIHQKIVAELKNYL